MNKYSVHLFIYSTPSDLLAAFRGLLLREGDGMEDRGWNGKGRGGKKRPGEGGKERIGGEGINLPHGRLKGLH